MSAAAVDAGDAPKKKGSKKMIIIIAAVLVLVLVGGGAFVMMKKKAAAEAEDGEETAEAAHDTKKDHKALPAFLPLDPFVVNLADRESERYAQIGVTLQVTDEHAAEELKAYMPAIRNGVLLVLASKTSADLLDRAGKEKLAAEILRASVKPLGIEVDEASADDHASADAADDDDKPKKKKKKKAPAEHNPVVGVHFSSFIIQ